MIFPIKLLSRRWLICTALLSLVLVLLSCTPSHPQSTFDYAGPVSKNLLNLFWIIFWMALAVFVIVIGALLYLVIRFREKKEWKMPVQVHGNRKLEIAWTVVPALLLIALAVMTVQTLFELRNPESNNPLRIEIIAHQWWFEVVYPEFNITSANEINVPVGRDVSVKLDSSDVIHSFAVPKLMGKMDIIPNHTNTTWFRADEPGVFFGQCAEFCGIAHALMKFRVVARPQEDFQDWITNQQAPARASSGAAAEGAMVFNSKGCIVCHTVNGPDTNAMRESRNQAFMGGQKLTHGPNLTHFATRSSFAGALVENNEENLKEWLRDPEKVKPGNRMARLAAAFNDPNFSLTETDILALTTYLQGLE